MLADSEVTPHLATPNSLWNSTAIDFPVLSPLVEDIAAEVVIIGAGFTGCSAALHLAENNVDVVLIDAGQPGIGASGRNGGQVIPGIKKTVEEVQQVWGREMGRSLYDVIGTAPDLVFELIDKHDIDCHPVRTGIIQPAYSKNALEYLKNYGGYHASTGAPVEFLDRQQVAELLGSDFYLGGFLDRRGGSVQPLSYCRGLAHAALKNGARLFGDTPAISIKDLGSTPKVISSSGSISAPKVLVCTNGYTNLVRDDPLIRKLSKSVIPFYSYQVATAPLSEDLQRTIIPQQQVIADTRRLLTYFRKDHMGRLVIGSAGGPYQARGADSYAAVESRIRELYPHIMKPEIEFRWCGKVCLTLDGVPHVHALSPGIFTALGYNGRGVGMASLVGKWLAAMVSDISIDTDTIPVTSPKTIPFHSMRKPFIKAMQYVKNFQDQLER